LPERRSHGWDARRTGETLSIGLLRGEESSEGK
jgi:hypothetical protein